LEQVNKVVVAAAASKPTSSTPLLDETQDVTKLASCAHPGMAEHMIAREQSLQREVGDSASRLIAPAGQRLQRSSRPSTRAPEPGPRPRRIAGMS
jgi:hypothetical protein